MGIIGVSVLSGICDRVASQAQLLKVAITSGQQTGLNFYSRIHEGVPFIGDYAVESQTINSARALDISTISGTLYKAIYNSFMQDLSTQVSNNGAASFDSYLAISGIHVNPSFDDVWFQTIGSHLSAGNVFFPQANILVATYAVTGSGTGTYTSNSPVGTNVGSYIDGTTNFAPAKFLLVPVQNVNGNIQLNLRLNAQNLAGGTTPAFANILINSGAGNSISGIQFIVNNISGQYLDCTNIIAAGGGGTDQFKVFALLERGITL